MSEDKIFGPSVVACDLIKPAVLCFLNAFLSWLFSSWVCQTDKSVLNGGEFLSLVSCNLEGTRTILHL